MSAPLCRVLAVVASLAAAVSAAGGEADPRVRPGSTFALEFPEFGKTCDGSDIARAEVYVPQDYTSERQFPLVVWFGGGKGTGSVDMLRSITAGSGFVCIALPYKWQPDGESAVPSNVRDQGWATQWRHYVPMLEALQRAVPNIHPELRTVLGFSSGGAFIGERIDENAGFLEYFRGIAVADYGYWCKHPERLKGHPVLFYCGDKDTRFPGTEESFAQYLTRGIDAEKIVFVGHGHEMPGAYFPKIREWIERKVLFGRTAEQMSLMKSAMAAKRHDVVVQQARLVLAYVPPERPEYGEVKALLETVSGAIDAQISSILAKGAKGDALRALAATYALCPAAARARAEAEKLAQTELVSIAAETGHARTTKLKRFIVDWDGYPVRETAMAEYEKEASAAYATLASSKPDWRRLKSFRDEWAPSPSAAKAGDALETMLEGELTTALAISSVTSRASRLKEFAARYKGTVAAEKAEAGYRQAVEQRASETLAVIKTLSPSAQKDQLTLFIATFKGTRAAAEAEELLGKLKRGVR